jgi:aminoglycoside phosphotransferase family enzyme/predicted kinase
MSGYEKPETGRFSGGGQEEVIAFLSRPESYGASRPAGAVERIETHSAIVFLVAGEVYKIKKAVKYPFLDFSTLKARHAACVNELRVNQHWAPEIYLGLTPIVRSLDGGLVLGGAGLPVEWAMRMRRFAQEDLYSARAARGELTPDDIARLALAIRAAHARADRILRAEGAFEAMTRLLNESAGSFESDPATFPSEAATRLIADSRAALEALRPLFRRRAHGGWVRRCHGDLHLGNIVQWRGAPTPFDAVEFDESIATVDVLDDLSFLIMDLWSRDLRSCANLLLNLYLAGDQQLDALAGLQALPLFLSARAMIRARAAAMRATHLSRAASGERERAEAKAAFAEADAYFALARRFLVPHPPRLVAVGGLSGSGKSTLARKLSPDLGPPPGAVHLQSDVERKVMFGLPPEARAPEEAYAPEISEALYRLLRKQAATALEAGCTVIVDATHLLPAQRGAIEETARHAGAKFTGIWLEAPEQTLLNRVRARSIMQGRSGQERSGQERSGQERSGQGRLGQGGFSDADVSILRRQLVSAVSPFNWNIVQAGKPLAELAVDCEKLL